MSGPYVSSDANNYVGVGKQVSRGTAVAPTVFAPYMGSVDLDHGISGDDVHEGGVGPYVARKMKTAHDPKGGFGMAWRPKTCAQLAAWFLGADASAASGSLWDHTATPATAPVYLSVEQDLADEIIERFQDCVLTELTAEGPSGGKDLMFGCKYAATVPLRQASATSETYETGISGSTPGGPFRQNEATYTVDGSAATNVDSWKLTLGWKIDNVHLSQVTGLYMMKLELTGKLTLKQLMLAETGGYRETAYGSASGTTANKNYYPAGAFIAAYDNGLATTNVRQVSFTVPGIDWEAPKYGQLNPDGQTMYLEREGTVRKVTGSAFVTVVSRTADTAAY